MAVTSKVLVGDKIINSIKNTAESAYGSTVTSVSATIPNPTTYPNKIYATITTASETVTQYDDLINLVAENDQNVNTWVVGQ